MRATLATSVLLTLFAALTCLSPAYACFSGLLIIPTADTVGADNCGIETQFGGNVVHKHVDTRLIDTEFGLGDRLEAGVDFDLSEDAPSLATLNAKYTLPLTKRHAMAAGVCNIGSHLISDPYLVLTTDAGAIRGHIGSINTDDGYRCFVGVDAPASKKLALMADYTAGGENFSSAGLNYQFSDSLAVLAGLEFANNGEDTRFTLHIVLNGRYKKEQGDRHAHS